MQPFLVSSRPDETAAHFAAIATQLHVKALRLQWAMADLVETPPAVFDHLRAQADAVMALALRVRRGEVGMVDRFNPTRVDPLATATAPEFAVASPEERSEVVPAGAAEDVAAKDWAAHPAEVEPKKPRAKKPKADATTPPPTAEAAADARYRERVEGATDFGGPDPFAPIGGPIDPAIRAINEAKGRPQLHKYLVDLPAVGELAREPLGSIEAASLAEAIRLAPEEFGGMFDEALTLLVEPAPDSRIGPQGSVVVVALWECLGCGMRWGREFGSVCQNCGRDVAPAEAAGTLPPPPAASAPVAEPAPELAPERNGALATAPPESALLQTCRECHHEWPKFGQEHCPKCGLWTLAATQAAATEKPLVDCTDAELDDRVKAAEERIATPPGVPWKAAEPTRWKILGAEGSLAFWIEAESADKVRALLRTTKRTAARAADYRVEPIAPGEWESFPDYFRSFHELPRDGLTVASSTPAKPAAPRPEPAGSLFKPAAVEPCPPGRWRYVAYDTLDNPIARIEAAAVADARRAMSAAYPPAFTGKIRAVTDQVWADWPAVPVTVVPAAPAPAPVAPEVKPAAPAELVAELPRIKLRIWEGYLWNFGRCDLIARASAPDLAAAREAIAAKFAAVPIVFPAPKTLVVRAADPTIAAAVAERYKLPRVDLWQTTTVETFASAPSNGRIVNPLWDLLVIADEGEDSHMGRIEAPDPEIAAELAQRRFPSLQDGEIVAVAAADRYQAELLGPPTEQTLPDGARVWGWFSPDLIEVTADGAEPEPAAELAAPSASPASTPPPAADPVPAPPAAVEPEPEPTAAEDEPADGAPDMDGMLLLASMANSRTVPFWEDQQREGATDDEIRTTLSMAFGVAPMQGPSGSTRGGTLEQGGRRCVFEGGKSPRFWFERGPDFANFRPNLEGKNLILHVRQVLEIPNPDGSPAPKKGRPGRKPKGAPAGV